MDQRLTRQLASLLLVIAIILIGIKNIQPKKEAVAAPEAGFIEVKQSDYTGLEKERDQWKQKYEELKQTETTGTEKEKEKEKEKTVVKIMHLNINDGMTSKEVSKQMEKAEIIKDANEFNDYLAAKNWQQSIQIGDYELTSEMDMQKIAETITGNLPKKE
ncbi:YqzC [Bacillus freudenreichii]|nr:YqzC [Bacillus freudenreichii]